MNYQKLARTLLDRVTRSSTPVVQSGEMTSVVGREAFGEALRLRWLAPDPDSGGLVVANSAMVLSQLREVSGGDYRSLSDVDISEDDDESAQVGDEVVVTVNGSPVKARVKAVNHDGTLVLDYPNSAPSTKPVKPNEVRLTSRPVPKSEPKPGFSDKPVQPVKPTTLVR